MLGQTEGGFNPNVTIKPVGFKTSVGPEEIREIVNRLNQKPFEEKLTLVSFDELNTLEFLELLNKVLAYLEPKHNVNIREETQEQTAVRVTEFLKVLNYPSNFDMNFQQNLVQADRRTVYPILYYILTRLPEHQKRAYLAKFLVPIQVPEEFLGDDEMKNTFNQYKDLQAEFQVIHQALDNVQKDSMNPADLKKEITQLEQEREQLNSKINSFKTKNQNKPEFQALLEATNLLRKEQEEEARIADKLRQQRDQLEYTDQLLLSAQQRLIEARKSMAPENTPEQMLQGLRNEVKKNRDMANERLAMEIGEKFKKIEALENILREPTPSTADMNMMENKVLQLRQQIGNLEEKLSKNAGNPADDKLAIYKQQAALVTKKKEKVFEDLKKAEEERNRLENEVAKKEQDLQKLKGPGYKSKDEFKQYAANLREKTNKFKKLKEELKEFRNEYAVLTRTEGIIANRKAHYEQILKKEENRLGIVGAVETHEKLQEVSQQKGIIDEKKGQTLEEISKIVINLESQLKAKRKHLEPKIKELKEYREKFGEIEKDYKQKKADYEHVLASTESEITALEAEAKKVRDDVYRDDTRISILDYQSQVLDLMFQRMNQEAEFNAGSKKLSNEAKSYKDFFENKITQQDAEVKDLRKQREAVKETYEPAQKQFAMFNDLKLLMNAKMRSMGSGGTGGGRNNEEAFGNVNRLVVRE